MPDMAFEFLGQALILPPPEEREIELDELNVSDCVTPSRAFLESVQRFGVITPIIVFDDGAKLRVADGRRRVAAARQAGLRAVPAKVYQAGSFIPDLLAVVLNEQRRDNPVADFNAIQRLQRGGATEREIGEMTGMPLNRIRRRMKLGTLHPDLFAVLGQGKVSVTVAEACAALPAAHQANLLIRLRESGRLTLPDVREVRTVRKADAVGALVLEGLGTLLSPATQPASLADIATALSTATLQRLLDELPSEAHFDTARQILAHELAATWRAPLDVEVFTRSGETVQAR